LNQSGAKARARRPRGARCTAARPRHPRPPPLDPAPKAHDAAPRDPRAHPPRAAPQTLVAVSLNRRLDPPAGDARACWLPRATPLNLPPRAPRHSLLALFTHPPIKRPPERLPARTPRRRPAIATAPVSTPLRRLPPQANASSRSPRTRLSFPHRLLLGIAPALAGNRAEAAAPQRSRRRRSSEPSQAEPPPPITLW
jgi:hypothetical protein